MLQLPKLRRRVGGTVVDASLGPASSNAESEFHTAALYAWVSPCVSVLPLQCGANNAPAPLRGTEVDSLPFTGS